MQLINENTEKILAEKVELADSFWSRLRGLMFRRKFEAGEALLFRFPEPRKFSIHTFFVFFPIDLIYLSDNFRVLETVKELPPWRTHSPKEASSFLVELPAGRIVGSETKVGDALEICTETGGDPARFE